MKLLDEALRELTADTQENKTRPLIIVVDELDRCRPDFSLSVLEVIKHFFSVPRVHFVLGVNLESLQHSVRVRYGETVEAEKYLRRFIPLTIELPQLLGRSQNSRVQIEYFRQTAAAMGLSEDRALMDIEERLELLLKRKDVAIRDIGRLLTHLVLLPAQPRLNDLNPGQRQLTIDLIFFKVLDPKLYNAAKYRTLTIEKLKDFFGITAAMIDESPDNPGTNDYCAMNIHDNWSYFLTDSQDGEKNERLIAKRFGNFGRVPEKDMPARLANSYLETFHLNGSSA